MERRIISIVLIIIMLIVCCAGWMYCGFAIGRSMKPDTDNWYAWIDRYACVHVDMGGGFEWYYQMDAAAEDWLLEVLLDERGGGEISE